MTTPEEMRTDSAHPRYDALPPSAKTMPLSRAINGVCYKLEDEPLTPDERRATVRTYFALLVHREAGFIAQEGVDEAMALRLAERIMTEGMRAQLKAIDPAVIGSIEGGVTHDGMLRGDVKSEIDAFPLDDFLD